MKASELGDGTALIPALAAISGDTEAIATIAAVEPKPPYSHTGNTARRT